MRIIATVLLGVGLVGAGSASAQEWMISPAPTLPLHAVTLAPPAPPPSPPPSLRAPLPPMTVASRKQDEIRRLLDPYGLKPLLAFSKFPATWLLGF